jgi:hypothetical protein
MNDDVVISRRELDVLRKRCSQRGARMQLLREHIIRHPVEWQLFRIKHPDADGWFDSDGSP